jgi:hypothetical protein
LCMVPTQSSGTENKTTKLLDFMLCLR